MSELDLVPIASRAVEVSGYIFGEAHGTMRRLCCEDAPALIAEVMRQRQEIAKLTVNYHKLEIHRNHLSGMVTHYREQAECFDEEREHAGKLEAALREIAEGNFGNGCGGGYSDEMGNRFHPCTMPKEAAGQLAKILAEYETAKPSPTPAGDA